MPDNASSIARIVSAILFAGFGFSALLSEHMVAEFKRYRLARFRVLTGALQVAGSVGLMAGQFYRPVLLISSCGLTGMMALGVATRIRIKDPLYAALPALALGVLNLFIFVVSLQARAL